MMSIPDAFGRRKKQQAEPMPNTDEPPSFIRKGAPPPLRDRVLHPAAQEAAAVYSEALEQADRMRQDLAQAKHEYMAEVDALRADLEVERRTNQMLREALDVERRTKDQYMRYAVEIRTHLAQVTDAATKANDLAMVAAHAAMDEPVAKQSEPPVNEPPLLPPAAVDEDQRLAALEDALRDIQQEQRRP